MGELLLLGVVSGTLISLMALGFALVYGTLQVIDFSHMDRLTVGAYFYLLLERHLGPVAAAAGGVLSASLFAVVTEFMIYRRIRHSGSTSIMIASLGLSVITQASLSLFFGSGLRVSTLDELAFDLAGFHLFPREILLFFVLILVLFGLRAMLFTGFGIELRAIAGDRNRAALFRVPTGRIVSTLFALAGALAGLAGVFVAISPGIHPYSGFKYMILAFAACTVAGLGNLLGTAVAGILIGILLSLAETYVSSLASEGIALLILCLVLLFRPEGLFTMKVRWAR